MIIVSPYEKWPLRFLYAQWPLKKPSGEDGVLSFETFNKPYDPPQAQYGRVQFMIASYPGGGRIKVTMARRTFLNVVVSRVKVLPWMSFQDTQPNGAGLRIYTMDSLLGVKSDVLQQHSLALKR